MSEIHYDAIRSSFAGMTAGPKPLHAAVQFYLGEKSIAAPQLEVAIIKQVTSDPNDDTRRAFHRQLKIWDFEPSALWSAGTLANTAARRARIYDLLNIDLPLRQTLDDCLPNYEGPEDVIIAPPHPDSDWYNAFRTREVPFYFPRVSAHLERVRGLPETAVIKLDAATTRILERLGDPSAPSPYAARGLVVGHVQSGKTANFTAVIAKVIDAGYRLVIVLSGTTNLLRNQTQRRIDMDLVGVENILRGATDSDKLHDYIEDSDWPDRFLSFTMQPSLLGAVDTVRVTGQEDFKSTNVGVSPFDFAFEKIDKQRPLYDRRNLINTSARVVVVKKQKERLEHLLKELKALGVAGCAEIPALIIDDESDQASINTLSPQSRTPDKTRTTINKLLVKLLKQLPRAQYIGYTATPFANVFVDLDDPEDIYPRDFILSLERPIGYMGAREFHDFGSVTKGHLSNEQAYVRNIPKDSKSTDTRLLEALDAFVLSGALKKFRASDGILSFKHHTMLVHESPFKDAHLLRVEEIRTLWKSAGYDSPGHGQKRLELLFKDFEHVWADRGKAAGLAFPKSFAALRPHLGAALDAIRCDGDPVLMVNSAEGGDVPDFDGKRGVWKIIVGGAKLSRGYTIEGLTISYFRRSSRLQDTLMQMGRWFGFRHGYSDLVRLYIGRSEKGGPTKRLDLYSMFESMCRDEESFREQLAIYDRRPDGSPGLTPAEVPALVFNSHPDLRPTAKNRMFNASLTWAGFTYREPTTQAADKLGRKHNAGLFEKLLDAQELRTSKVTRPDSNSVLEVRWATASHDEVLGFLTGIAWHGGAKQLAGEIGFLGREECPVRDWIILAPQVHDSKAGTWEIWKGLRLACISRTRPATDTRFGVFSDPSHLEYARWIVGSSSIKFGGSDGISPSKSRGVLLLYPTREKKGAAVEKGLPVMGFALQLPNSPSARRAAFTVQRKSTPDAIVVPAPRGAKR
jgi:hypothetical protein